MNEAGCNSIVNLNTVLAVNSQKINGEKANNEDVIFLSAVIILIFSIYVFFWLYSTCYLLLLIS